MRLDIREPKRHVASIEFDRWFNGGRRIISKPDKVCKLRRKYIKLEQVARKSALYGPHRGG